MALPWYAYDETMAPDVLMVTGDEPLNHANMS